MAQDTEAGECIDTSTLQLRLSPEATITAASGPFRWSEYKTPRPGRIVHPATALDVSNTVEWANECNVPFLVQGGGNGWANTFTIFEQGIIIELDKLCSVSFSQDRSQVTIGGGALIKDVVAAAAANSSLVLTGTCNGVGALGAILGGGFSNLSGQFGLGVDDVLSLDVIKPNGDSISLSSAQDAGHERNDLFWAMRGAGPNFGVVTSATLRAHPVPADMLNAWAGPLRFAPSQLEAVISAIKRITFRPQMAMSLNFLNLGTPTILTNVFYHGPPEEGRLAFDALLSIGPLSDGTTVLPYTKWNAGSDIACIKGGRRPTVGVGLAKLETHSWRHVFDTWVELIQQPGAEKSSVLLTVLPMAKARTFPDSSSAYPFRSTINFHASFTAFYTNTSFDDDAIAYCKRARDIWQATDGLAQHSTYINNGFGDENLETIYGENLERLKAIKKQVDPRNRLNQWFPLV